jgi:hypothetical protein
MVEVCRYFEAKVESARQMHEDVRQTYAPLLTDYIADNPGSNLDDLKDEVGPQHVQNVRKYIKILQDAENALETAREAARKAGIDPNAEHAQDLDSDENVPNMWVTWEVQRLIAEVDRKKISRWLDVSGKFEPWPLGFPKFDTFSEIESSFEGCELLTRGSCKVRHKQRDTSSSRNNLPKPSDHRLTTSDVRLDSVSRFDDYDYRRHHIDAWAQRVREGYL